MTSKINVFSQSLTIEDLGLILHGFADHLLACVDKMNDKAKGKTASTRKSVQKAVESPRTVKRVAKTPTKRLYRKKDPSALTFSQWQPQSITAEAFQCLFGRSEIPLDPKTNGQSLGNGCYSEQTTSGTWFGTYNRAGRLRRLRLRLNDMRHDLYRMICSRMFWKRKERDGLLSPSILDAWYFIRHRRSPVVVREFLQTMNLDDFGLQCVTDLSRKKYKVVDEAKFREALRSVYGIELLPGDRGWWAREFRSRCS